MHKTNCPVSQGKITYATLPDGTADVWIRKNETQLPESEEGPQGVEADDKYYIRINDEFKENTTIEGFYNKLCLGSELHRLDYLIMNIIGLQRYCEDNSDLYVGLGKILDIIREKRNIM